MTRWLYVVWLSIVLGMGVAHAQRAITLNGQWLTPQQIALLDQANCTTVPNGHYWVNIQTGVWGYMGNPQPQGRVGEHCASHQSYHRRTPFGYLGSDGNTSYYYDSDSGCSVIPGAGVSC